MNCQLVIEVEADECGYHSVIIDVSDDSILHVGNTYSAKEDAERAARDWINRNYRWPETA